MCQPEIPSSSPETPSAQAVVKQFVRNYVKGRRIDMVTAQSSSNDCLATLDRKLSALSITSTRKKNCNVHIPLETVEEISMGTDCQEDVDFQLDDLCVTLFLDSGEDGENVGSVSFRFQDNEERDTFALCLSMFVDGRRGSGSDGDPDPHEAAESSGNESDEARFFPPVERTESTEASSSSAPADAKAVVKEFVRSFVKGHRVSVLTVHGGTSDCLAFLDRKLTTLSIQRGEKKDSRQRHIPLEQVDEISVGTEASEDVEMLPLDENCVTLLLEGGQGIAFQFQDQERRDTFALCLSMFVDGRRAAKKSRNR